ncbi:MAG: carbohydrate ABC transporter permease [Candidatus Izemoplasmataceae bacterium]|jgi:multiple sugar transport system permease protein|uniref:carbohydrate ABC transporter permease n=1 Tax=Liberiplasma polymorphum TaxID=3374570 RepID=UPI0037768986
MRYHVMLKEAYLGLKDKDMHRFKVHIRRFFMGMKFTDGFIFKLGIYALLISLGYIYLYPMLYMVTNSFMTMSDIISVSVRWIPSRLNWENYQIVWREINYPRALRDAIILAGVPALSATFSSALIGYGFAKYDFPLKKLLMILMIMTFIIPPQITMMPTFRMYASYGLLGSIRAFVYPAILGQGFNGAIFILIFYSFFRMIPKSLEESAQLDGASPFKVFTKIALPLAVPAIIIVFLFSFVWYYNETYLTGLFLRGSTMSTLPLRVESFINNYTSIYPEGSRARELMQAAKLAGNILALLPLLVLYFFTQRYFVESIDKTGITGE